MSQVKIVLEVPDAKVPMYVKEGDAGCDVSAVKRAKQYTYDEQRAAQYRSEIGEVFDERMNDSFFNIGDYILPPGKTELIDLGFRIQLEPGFEMQVRSRSGLAKRGLVVANAPGTIDSGYRGPCMVLLHNNSDVWRVIKPEVRVAQFVLKRAPQASFLEVNDLDDSDRGAGGFGSTGTK